MKLEFYGQIFDKSSNIKFHENSLSGRRTVSSGRTDGQTYTKRLAVVFLNSANEPKSNKKLNWTVQRPLAASSTKDTVILHNPRGKSQIMVLN